MIRGSSSAFPVPLEIFQGEGMLRLDPPAEFARKDAGVRLVGRVLSADFREIPLREGVENPDPFFPRPYFGERILSSGDTAKRIAKVFSIRSRGFIQVASPDRRGNADSDRP